MAKPKSSGRVRKLTRKDAIKDLEPKGKAKAVKGGAVQTGPFIK